MKGFLLVLASVLCTSIPSNVRGVEAGLHWVAESVQGNVTKSLEHAFVDRHRRLDDTPFVEHNGLVVMEMESQPVRGDWKFEKKVSGYTGSGYCRMDGNTVKSGSPNGRTSFFIRIIQPGLYRMSIRSYKSNKDSTWSNDCYTKMVGHPGYQGRDTKTYMFGDSFKWSWSTTHQLTHDEQYTPFYDLSAGVHELQVSGRSKDFHIDRIILYDYRVSTEAATRLNQPESRRGSGPAPIPPPPVRAPVPVPVPAPVAMPVRMPVPAPVPAPVRMPVPAPVRMPVRSPTPPTSGKPIGIPDPPPGSKVIADHKFTDSNEGFRYEDDLFRHTRNEEHANGWWTKVSERITIRLGGFSGTRKPMSGGLEKTWRLDSESHLRLQFNYKINYPTDFDDGEDTEVLCSLNGKLYGQGTNDYVDKFYGSDRTTSEETIWFNADVDLGKHPAGNLDFAIGAYLTGKHEEDQRVVVLIDNILVTASRGDDGGGDGGDGGTEGPYDSAVIMDHSFTTSTDGFEYMDDVFRRTNKGHYAWTWYERGSTDRLLVALGGRDARTIDGISGGYKKSFSLTEETHVTVEFRHKFGFGIEFERGEDAEVLCSVDGKLHGVGGKDYVDIFYGRNANIDTEWKTTEVDLGRQSAGRHEFAVGGYLSRKTSVYEVAYIAIDDVYMTIKVPATPAPISRPTPAPVAPPTPAPVPPPRTPAPVAPTPPVPVPAPVALRPPPTPPTPPTPPAPTPPVPAPGPVAVRPPPTPPTPPAPTRADGTILDADFALGTFGFEYMDDVFRFTTDSGRYAEGRYKQSQGRIVVDLGGRDNDLVYGMSGGFKTSFTLSETSIVQIEIKYKLSFPNTFDRNENAEVLCSVNGILLNKNGLGKPIVRYSGEDGEREDFLMAIEQHHFTLVVEM